jgi:hypothetical protein
MKLGVKSGLGLVVAATLFAAPVMGQEDSSEEDDDAALQDVTQTAAEQALDRATERPSAEVRGTSAASGVAEESVQGVELRAAGAGDDALHAIPVTATSHGDDVVRGAGAVAHADDVARGVGAVSLADDAARVAGGSLAKIGGVLAALGAILVKLLSGGKKDE